MKNNSLLNYLFFIFLILIFITACSTPDDNTPQIEPEAKPEELDETLFLQNDFTLSIDTLPYRGAVLFIDYLGEIDISDYELWVEIVYDEKITQRDLVVETVGNSLVSEIVDLMYLPGDDLKFVLKIKEEDNAIFESNYSEQLQRYPWKDWMYENDESAHVNPWTKNFTYHEGFVGAHSSWDIATRPNAPVYSGTIGVVMLISTDPNDSADGAVYIFNPHVGAILQYGHITPAIDLYEDKAVEPGEYIGSIAPSRGHVHYSVIRPLKLGWDRLRNSYWCVFNVPGVGNMHNLEYYQDPFYFHEPTTLGYWNEETLPPGLKEDMIISFQKYNPNVTLPAKAPLE